MKMMNKNQYFIVKPCADATYTIKDSANTTLYSGSIASGGDLQQTVSDSEVTVNGNAYANVKATDALDVPVEYENGTPVGTINAGVVKIPNPVTPSGIAYQRPQPTGQVTSYRTYDDGWNLANGIYSYVPPANPIYLAELDYTAISPFHRLKNNNAFGNKFRFTTANGSYWDEQANTYHLADGTLSNLAGTYVSLTIGSYVLDNLTGLGYFRETVNTYNFDDLVDYPIGKTFATYTDWRLVNINEIHSLRNYNVNTSDNVTKVVLGSSTGTQGGTCTTFANDTTRYVQWAYYTTVNPIVTQAKTVALRLTMVRNHFN